MSTPSKWRKDHYLADPRSDLVRVSVERIQSDVANYGIARLAVFNVLLEPEHGNGRMEESE